MLFMWVLGALLGVWGIVPWLYNPHDGNSCVESLLWFVVVGLCGVLCENCIVDASIKPHAFYHVAAGFL